MSRVLSVDLDFILEPCIQLYDDLIRVGSKGKNWEVIYQERDIERHLSFDKERVKFISNFLARDEVISNCKGLYVGKEHSSIIMGIDDSFKKGYLKGKIDLVNIGHHHDIFYNEIQERDVFLYDVAQSGSWAAFLAKHGVLSSYTWIKNKNSRPFLGATEENQKYCGIDKILTFGEDSVEEFLKGLSYDVIYITSSYNCFPEIFEKNADEIIDFVIKQYMKKHIPFIDFADNVSHPSLIPRRYKFNGN